jgi:hypothetical protein
MATRANVQPSVLKSVLRALVCTWVCCGAAAGTDPEDGVEFFEKEIRPVLAQHCYECHSAESKKLKGGLRLDSREAVLRGGDSGPAAVAGDPETSRLVVAVSGRDKELEMPPKKPLEPAQIKALTEWVWASDFLPGAHQGTLVSPGAEPIANIKRLQPDGALQELELGFTQKLNRAHLARRGADPLLSTRIRSMETAFGMQMEAPEALDLTGETDATLALYGLARGATKGFGWQCLAARRLAERGVRFIELIDTGASGNWDSHSDMADHGRLARNVDQPIAGLLRDLKSRGMLEDMLVVWTTEFGRTPFNSKKDAKGREHHAEAFSTWMAGGGVKAGFCYGQTDEYGCRVEKDEVHIHDFHATLLHLMGLDHERLTFRHGGRDYRLTDVAGNVVHQLFA